MFVGFDFQHRGALSHLWIHTRLIAPLCICGGSSKGGKFLGSQETWRLCAMLMQVISSAVGLSHVMSARKFSQISQVGSVICLKKM